MRDANLYKEAAEKGFVLRIDENGAWLSPLGIGDTIPLVSVSAEGIKSVVPKTWEVDIADRLARMMRAEITRVLKAADKPIEPINK